jgi:hypothetical protein
MPPLKTLGGEVASPDRGLVSLARVRLVAIWDHRPQNLDVDNGRTLFCSTYDFVVAYYLMVGDSAWEFVVADS